MNSAPPPLPLLPAQRTLRLGSYQIGLCEWACRTPELWPVRPEDMDFHCSMAYVMGLRFRRAWKGSQAAARMRVWPHEARCVSLYLQAVPGPEDPWQAQQLRDLREQLRQASGAT